MLSFRRFTHSNVFDVTSPEDDVLINFLSRGGRPICGTVFSTKGPHLGVEKKKGYVVILNQVHSISPPIEAIHSMQFPRFNSSAPDYQRTIPARPQLAKLQKVLGHKDDHERFRA